MMFPTRRQFLEAATVAAAAATATATPLSAQQPPEAAATAAAPPPPDWGGKVIDIHSHLRQNADANAGHLDGSGVSNAILLARAGGTDLVKQVQAKYPGRFVWSASADITKPDAEAVLTKAVREGGACGFGELKFHVAADGPELRRMYALAGELGVPILVHFQEVDHFPGEGKWSTGFKNFARILKEYPKTRFVGHADAFWANISADYAEEAAYPATPVKKGGITDKLLADFPNLFGDCSANSGNNGLSRSPEFTADFLKRHQNKLMFGSDCACPAGRGGGVGQPNNPAAARLAGKCVARETLALLKRSTSPAIFRKIVWENAHKVYKLKA